MSNSALVSYTKRSPHHSGARTHEIDTITIHCMAGNLTVETCGALFAKESREASSNYGIGSDGRIALYVDEANRSWCTSSRANDQRAITIEVANTQAAHPWPVSDAAYAALLELLADIFRRHGKTRLLWLGDREKTLAYTPRPGEMVMTVHRWFANKACPGDWLYSRHGQIAAEIIRRLEEKEDEDTMTQEQFDAMLDDYQRRHALPVPDSTPADWEREGVDWAVETGLMAGDGIGNLMLHAPLTRAQFCVMLKRYHAGAGSGR